MKSNVVISVYNPNFVLYPEYSDSKTVEGLALPVNELKRIENSADERILYFLSTICFLQSDSCQTLENKLTCIEAAAHI